VLDPSFDVTANADAASLPPEGLLMPQVEGPTELVASGVNQVDLTASQEQALGYSRPPDTVSSHVSGNFLGLRIVFLPDLN
jgi:hypothetical protein